MYHGTEKKRGERILAAQKMSASISTDRKQHWLGDGIYLYRVIFYVFRWILLMYENRFGKDNEEKELLEKFSILKVDIEYDPDRIFNLADNPEHYMVFKQTEKEVRKKSVFSSKLEKMEYTDGVIINIMFKNLKYIENYDAVEAAFPICYADDSSTDQSRLKSMNEYQICIKNDKIIKEIRDVTESIDYKEYKKRYTKFEKFRTSNDRVHGITAKYVNGQRSGKYGKRENFGR